MLAPGLLHGWGGSGGRSEAKLGTKQTDADVGGRFSLTGVSTSPLRQIAGGGNITAFDGGISVLRLVGNGTTFTWFPPGIPGQLLLVLNVSNNTQEIVNNHANAPPGGRIIFNPIFASGTTNVILNAGDGILLWYDAWTRTQAEPILGTSPNQSFPGPGAWRCVGRSTTSGMDAGSGTVNIAATGGLVELIASTVQVGGGGRIIITDSTSSVGDPSKALMGDPAGSYTVWADPQVETHYNNAR